MTADLTRKCEPLSKKLEELKARDRRLRVFGAGGSFGHRYRCRPSLTATQLEEFQHDLGVELPAELECFLRTVQGGGAGPGYGLTVVEDATPVPRRARPFPFDGEVAAALIRQRLAGGSGRWACVAGPDDDDEDEDWPPGPGFLPLAHHGCGVYDVLVVAGEQRGYVWSVDTDQWWPAFDASGRQLGFFDWYEQWLDNALSST